MSTIKSDVLLKTEEAPFDTDLNSAKKDIIDVTESKAGIEVLDVVFICAICLVFILIVILVCRLVTQKMYYSTYGKVVKW